MPSKARRPASKSLAVPGTVKSPVGQVVDDVESDTKDSISYAFADFVVSWEENGIERTVSRSVKVRIPSDGQILVLRRFSDRFAPDESGNHRSFPNAEAVIKASNRAFEAATSVIVDDDDVEWVEDLMMSNKIDLPRVADFIKVALRALAAANPEVRIIDDDHVGRPRARLVTRFS
jgi:hypothetical protein